ncbi:Ff.00g034650.m01.CDS01 [Fusarium sp. VM40]|nr:Ff.00g034650.m01.CDS01 [Fusarium sp. VM40]
MSKNTRPNFLSHWSFDSFKAKAEAFREISDSEEHENETSDFTGNSTGARSFLRLQRNQHTEDPSLNDHDHSTCTGIGDGIICEACLNRKDGISSVQYFHIDPTSQLLHGSEDPEDSEQEVAECANLHPNDQSLWAEEPDFYRSLTADGMGFLSQVAHICRYSELSFCHNSDCKSHRETMESRFPLEDGAWPAFRSWALTAMSCQQQHRQSWADQKYHAAHTHIASAVAALAMALAECSRPCYRNTIFRSQLDTVDGDVQDDKGSQTLMNSTWNVLYWMISVQYSCSVGPDKFGRWGSDMLSSGLINWNVLQSALDATEETKVCKYRLWNLLNEGDRGDADLFPIVSYLLRHNTYMEQMSHDDHDKCTPGFCQKGTIDSNKAKQMHSSHEEGNECTKLEFDMSKVDKAVDAGRNTAWLCNLEDGQPQINQFDNYVALSHVWSDRTGVGIGERDNNTCQVNKCLWTFWHEMITQSQGETPCDWSPAIWWDTVSIPQDKEKRNLAIKSLHRNYSKAKRTIVHDTNLANIDCQDDGVRCVALALSNWFSRGWTALELQMSKEVWVIFKDGDTYRPILLDKLLVKSLSMASPALTDRPVVV